VYKCTNLCSHIELTTVRILMWKRSFISNQKFWGWWPCLRLEGVKILCLQWADLYRAIIVWKIHVDLSNIHKVMTNDVVPYDTLREWGVRVNHPSSFWNCNCSLQFYKWVSDKNLHTHSSKFSYCLGIYLIYIYGQGITKGIIFEHFSYHIFRCISWTGV